MALCCSSLPTLGTAELDAERRKFGEDHGLRETQMPELLRKKLALAVDLDAPETSALRRSQSLKRLRFIAPDHECAALRNNAAGVVRAKHGDRPLAATLVRFRSVRIE